MDSKDLKITNTKWKRAIAFLIYILLAALLLLTACGGSKSEGIPESPFAGRDAASLDAYFDDLSYEKESRLVDTTVAEIDQLMKDKESFVFIAAYEDCDYCKCIMPYFNDALADADTYAGYLDTRKDPSWENNTDIDDYDLFTERFGKFLEEEDGVKHLYTPDIYVIRNGRVVAEHQGVVEGVDDPEQPLTESQEQTLKGLLKEMLSELEQ